MATGHFFIMEQQKHLRNQEGFTLIEIIAVLLILSLLAGLTFNPHLMWDDIEQR